MIEKYLSQIQKEAEALYFEMSNGQSVSIKVGVTPDIPVAGIHTPTRRLYVHPLFLMPKEEVEKLYPNASSSLAAALREDSQMFTRARHAILAHEIAHLYLGHGHSYWHRWLATWMMIPSSALIIPYCTPIPFLVILLTIRKLCLSIFSRLRALSEKHHEFHADFKGLKTTKDFEAFKYFLRKAEPLATRFSFSHPQPTERLNYLKEQYV